MGYDLHITRADDWSRNEGHEISAEEWHDLVELDTELRFARYNGPHFAIWNAHPDGAEVWLDWHDGNVTAKNPDEALLGKLLEIARKLNAKVQGDDGETYTESDLAAARVPKVAFSEKAALAMVLSILALVLVTALVGMNAHVRPGRARGAPVPIGCALAMASIMMLAVPAWIAAGVAAICSLVTRGPRKWMAWAALLMNAIGGGIVVLFG